MLTPILTLFLLINLSNIALEVNGDATLVNDVCTKTPYPKECIDCFNDNSGAVQMTRRELAAAAMWCTYNTSGVLQQNFVDLASKAPNPKIRLSFEACNTTLYSFKDKLAGAQGWWSNCNNEEAKKDFNGAKDDYLKCEDAIKGLIKSVNQDLPSQVVVLFNGLRNLYLDTNATIVRSDGDDCRGYDVVN